ncbi:MAG: TonB-dependent receptor plug domain-containing protein [Burkholderiaceae bacterium]
MTRPPRLGAARTLALAALLPLATATAQAAVLSSADLGDLSIEDLGRIPVTSVSGRPEEVQDAAASIFVITADDIRRSAATSLPEALRLAPNLQVARINATQYAISARGFNNAIGNKLLVMVDGRTVYSPLFSGVFWDAQQVPLADVERIEVISGAGGTLWGANAVNGVINVITRAAQDTPGWLLAAHAGATGNEATLRYGGVLPGGGWRAYATQSDRASTTLSSGKAVDDHQDRQQAGFRADWSSRADSYTVQGDVYQSAGDGRTPTSADMSGANVLARWRHDEAGGGNWQLQAWFDQASRDDQLEFHDHVRTLDLQFNHAPALGADHRLIWGLGYRRAIDETDPALVVAFDPRTRLLHWANVFAQDDVRVTQRLRVVAGAKVETNAYTGAEFLPTLRAAWDLGAAGTLWGSASRAVRAPARLDRDVQIPAKPPFIIDRGPDFHSEVADVFEVGLRGQRASGFGYSATVFHHHYRDLRAGHAAPTTVDNLAWGNVSGFELWGNVDVTRDWRLALGWTELRESLRAAPTAGRDSVSNLGDDPRRQIQLRSTMRPVRDVDLDLTLRHVAALPAPAVPAYTVVDARLAWSVRPDLDLSLIAQELGRRHVEFDPASSSRFGPRAFVQLEWRTP